MTSTVMPSPFNGNPPKPRNSDDRFWITVDTLDSSDMRALWVAVERDGLSKPVLDNARKHVGMSDADLVVKIRAYLAHTTSAVRESTGGRYLAAWYAPLPAQATLFDLEAAR